MIGASVNDSPEALLEFSKQYEITYPLWRDSGTKALTQLTEQGVIPRTVVLDTEHRIVLLELGYTEEKFKEVVRAVKAVVAGTEFQRRRSSSTTMKPETKLNKVFTVRRIDTVASEGSVGFFTSMALDSEGNPAIASKDYGKGALLVSRWSGSEWKNDWVDSNAAGWSPSIAIDSENHPAVTYGAGYDKFEVRYAVFDGKSWNVEVVDDKGNPFKATSLVYSLEGQPSVSYFAKDEQELRFARRDLSEDRWEVESVDSQGNVGTYTSLRFDSNGPMIAYYDEGNQSLKFARMAESLWKIEKVDDAGKVGLHDSMALDNDGNPAIAYFDLTNEDLKLARWDGTQWQINTVDSQGTVGQRCSLKFDSKGNPHISYFGNGNLKLAFWNDDAWEIMVVDNSGLTGNYTSLALDSKDNVRISYFDVNNADLKFAWVDRN